MRHIRKDSYIKGLWRNGRGVSWEIASDTTAEDFTWRFAIAEIAASGPFSLYGPVDRIFTLLSGQVDLDFADGKSLQVKTIFEPHTFPCDVETYCTLRSAQARALNLFISRKSCRAEADIIQLNGSQHLPSGTSLLFALQGTVSCNGMDLAEGDAALLDTTRANNVHASSAILYAARLVRA